LRQLQGWSPQIEVTEHDGRLVVRADVPGVATEDLQIELEGDVLTISGERRSEQAQQRGNRGYTERTYGAFSRTIPLPEGVDADQVEASFENGVLEVSVTLPQQGRSRQRIPIRGGQEESTGQPH
jgi:HSP20 family protein